MSIAAHLDQTVTSLVTCWRVETADGALVLGFTNHTRTLLIDGVSYQAETGITPTTTERKAGLSVSNLDIRALLSSEAITEADLLAGVWDYAKVTVFLVNYRDTRDQLIVHKGRLGEVTLENGAFTAEARSLLQNATQQLAVLTSATCRVKALGDSKCGVNLAPFTKTGAISASSGRGAFSASGAAASQAEGYFDFGIVTFTSGANAGRSMEIKSASGAAFVLQQPMPFPFTVGDTFTAVAGCDRRRDTCKDKFGNVINFRGEPDIPGTDAVLKQAESSE